MATTETDTARECSNEHDRILKAEADWYNLERPQSWMRKKQLNYGEGAEGRDLYSRGLAHVVDHWAVKDRGEDMVQKILREHLLWFAGFTVNLEMDIVNPAFTLVAMKRALPPMSEATRWDAWRTVDEEVHHSYESGRIMRQFTGTEVSSIELPQHPFLALADNLQANVPAAQRAHVLVAAATTTETAITGTLDVTPGDQRVAPGVRRYMAEHAIDEGRHFRLTLDVFEQWWPQLTPAQRDLIGPMFPEMFKKYLTPDVAAIERLLQGLGFDGRTASTIVCDTYSNERLRDVALHAGRHSLRAFERLGLIDEYRSAFVSAGLL